MKAWYTVTAMRSVDVCSVNPEKVQFEIFEDPDVPGGYSLAIEIARNKLHTTDDLFIQFCRT